MMIAVEIFTFLVMFAIGWLIGVCIYDSIIDRRRRRRIRKWLKIKILSLQFQECDRLEKEWEKKGTFGCVFGFRVSLRKRLKIMLNVWGSEVMTMLYQNHDFQLKFDTELSDTQNFHNMIMFMIYQASPIFNVFLEFWFQILSTKTLFYYMSSHKV